MLHPHTDYVCCLAPLQEQVLSEHVTKLWAHHQTLFFFFFSTLVYSYIEHFKSLNCIAYQMKSSTSSLTLSGNSTEQTERGIQLKCWKTFRKESDVIPCWAGLPRLPPGQHAPQIAGQETAGRMRLIPTPWMPRLCVRWGWSFTQNIPSGWSAFAFFDFQWLKHPSQDRKRRSFGVFWGIPSSCVSCQWLCCLFCFYFGKEWRPEDTALTTFHSES